MIKKRECKKRIENINKVLPHNNSSNYGSEIKYDNIVDYCLNKPVPCRKSKTKINADDFTIPNFSEYYNILDINYNLQQLKAICKAYNLKLTGNKDELKKRIYNYMHYSYKATFIQKFVRMNFVKIYLYLHGPGFYNKLRCTNDTDFCSLDYLTDIPYTQFICFKDEDNFIFGFDIKSLYNLYLKNKTQIENPFTKKIINKEVFDNMIYYIKYSNILNIAINIDYSELEKINESKKLELKILTLFQTIDSLGNYTNMSWFTNLTKYDLIRFVRELFDIWNYRANLTQETKREICPPFGKPFRIMNMNMNIHYINGYSYNTILKNVVYMLDELINKGINDDSRSLGCYYILCALTLVSPDAAEALPWLYESVNYEPNY